MDVAALVLGLALGIFGRPDSGYAGLYDPLFRGLLSILMLIMGMEAWSRLSELRSVTNAYITYGLAAPLVHGLMGFGVGLAAHLLTGFSAGALCCWRLWPHPVRISQGLQPCAGPCQRRIRRLMLAHQRALGRLSRFY